jgi:hypothetical protein
MAVPPQGAIPVIPRRDGLTGMEICNSNWRTHILQRPSFKFYKNLLRIKNCYRKVEAKCYKSEGRDKVTELFQFL